MSTYYEFFAGGGMARAGLGPDWSCVFANDIDPRKAQSYVENWGDGELLVEDVAKLKTSSLPGRADMAWASFPCQDLSLAGVYAGLSGERSGTFWPFWRLMRQLQSERRSPRMIVLENVYGALTAHGGQDFATIAEAFADAGYRFGALVVDARLFVPQSRPRLFVVGIHEAEHLPENILSSEPSKVWHPRAVLTAYKNLSDEAVRKWLWLSPSVPAARNSAFHDLVESDPAGVRWHTAEETAYITSLMSPVNRTKLDEAIMQTKSTGSSMVGCVYRRTREGQQRAEIRFDDVAGCLRTPAGGSSRQTIVLVEAGRVRSRLLSPREGARLMGLPDTYKLPSNYNQAYHLVGDGVVVPAVRHLARELLRPILLKRSEATAPLAAAE